MSNPAELIEYAQHKWIDPLAVREIKLLPQVDDKDARVLVMRDGTHTSVEFSTTDDAEAFIAWLAAEVNRARRRWCPSIEE